MAVGELLTADTSSISDENGLDRVKFYYQWISSDGTTDTYIAGATGSSFRLTDADVGKTIKLRVSFTDRHGFPESLADTELLINTAKSNQIATGAPTISGVAWVGETLTADTADIQDEDGLTDVEYEYQWVFVGERADKDIEGATNATYTLPEAYVGKAIRVRVTFTDDLDNEESLVSEATAAVAVRPNTPATGAPTIKGTLEIGETLTAGTSDIQDEDGLDNASYGYQWIVVDGATETEVAGATSSTYALVLEYLGKAVKVRVSFTDDRGHEESLTSAATEAVTCDNQPTPTEVAVTAVPIVVTSTEDEYFVLYASHETDGSTSEYPVLVKLGEDGTTTLSENVEALAADRYRVEKYLVANPGDVDGDCLDDLTELSSLGRMNPVNHGGPIELADGVVALTNLETFEALAPSDDSGTHTLKFVILKTDSDRPRVYFQNTHTHWHHYDFTNRLRLRHGVSFIRGMLSYDPGHIASDGSRGIYRYMFNSSWEPFSRSERVYTLLAASMPLIDDNLVLWVRGGHLLKSQAELPLFQASRIDLVFDQDVYGGISFLALNPGEGYGLLRDLEPDERPHSRDVVIYETLPNELPRVAGIISTVPQTPLSHVNLRALQDSVPNAFIADALEDDEISGLIGNYVYYAVTEEGYSIREATQAEVEAHYASSRPAETQTPQRDLTATSITALSDIGFDDWDAFGVKAANVAVLGTLGFPDGTVPDGFAIPFYFYDEFMKHSELYDDIEAMLADEDFQTDYDTMESKLKKLRKKIKKADTPDWIETALTAMHATYPEGQSLRYRSSTNNEDLPGFNGAGLYDSKTQHPEETEEDGISKSLKQVYASLWNFRAFIERDFHRIDHMETAMGVLVHPNYSDELVNGVAVSVDPIAGTEGAYYVNSQVGEDLVTNPEANSVPEETLLFSDGKYTVVALSNQVPRGRLLMSDDQLAQLRRYLAAIHDKFEELYDIEDGEQFAMEIEFKITSDNVLAIKQARPWIFSDTPTDVSNAPVADSGAALTGRFEGVPQKHTGQPFTFNILFSDDVTIRYREFRGYSFAVTGGYVKKATRVDERDDLRRVLVIPDSDLSDVTILLRHGLPCTAIGAICTYDGRRLSSRLERTIFNRLQTPARGGPIISGAAHVGETLTSDTSGITDVDGLTNATFTYQWISGDDSAESDIAGATGPTYTLVSGDMGKTLKLGSPSPTTQAIMSR